MEDLPDSSVAGSGRRCPVVGGALFALSLALAVLARGAPATAQAETCTYVLRRAEEAEPASGAVIVLDTATGAQNAVVPVGDPPGSAPSRIALAPDGTRAYVTFRSPAADGVSILETATSTVIGTVHGDVGCGVAVSPDGALVYAGDEGGDLAVIDTVSNQIVDEVAAAGGCDVRVSTSGRRVYVLGRDRVEIVDAEERRIVDSVRLDTARSSTLALPPGSLVYAAEEAGRVFVIETPADVVAARISSACREEGVLADLAATPNGRLLYAAHAYANGAGCVALISATSQTSSISIALPSGAGAVATGTDGLQAYVGSNDAGDPSLYVVDAAAESVVDTLPLAPCAAGASRCSVADVAVAVVPNGCRPPPSPSPTPAPATATRTMAPTPLPGPCHGDCDGDGSVVVAELVRGVAIALVTAPLEACRSIDSDADGAVTIDDLIRAVTAAVSGCAGV